MLKSAIASFKAGGFVITHDGAEREGEADLMLHASFITPEKVRIMRRDGGGLICVAIDSDSASKIGVSYLTEIFKAADLDGLVIKQTPYGDKPAFSLSINHRSTFTGITDNDRAKTIGELAKLLGNGSGDKSAFARNFYAPGHVPLLIGRSIKERKGHTELALELARRSNLPPVVAMCEMLGEGTALTVERAGAYSRIHGIPFIEGKELLKG